MTIMDRIRDVVFGPEWRDTHTHTFTDENGEEQEYEHGGMDGVCRFCVNDEYRGKA